jgi:ssDNA-binding Zn-finger/Zn-ribbon topoisomerase 1
MLYNVLKFENSLDISKRAEATWTKSFFSNAECPQCNFIYKQAELFVKSNVFMLPNTEPAPAH